VKGVERGKKSEPEKESKSKMKSSVKEDIETHLTL